MKKVARRPVMRAKADWQVETEVRAPQPAARAENRRQRLLIRIGILLPLVLLVITLARGASEKRGLPDLLLGVWQSSDANYADCYMEITPATLMFGNAQRGYLLYFVSSFQQVGEAGQTAYLIHYTDLDGVKYEMTICYKPKPQETLYFKNQARVVWNRRPSA